ncbi:amidohydrolase family protein [Rhizobium sp. RAF36]|uniref:amidohydrolase family protein n=1 Tax=Rhizobium sp. RAF36 TaxID=3233055 RepID=UPI003F9BF5E8
MMSTPVFDLLIRNARLERFDRPVDIGIARERIAAIGANLVCEAIETTDAQGALASRGFTDSHVHLDKACILDRCSICEGTLGEAISETAKAKADFTEQDVYARAARVVEKAIVNGTMRMRTFVETDPRAGMRSFEAIKQIRQDYAFAIDIEICAFAQDGLTNEPQTLEMLDAALSDGADLVGGAPYIDPDPQGQIRMIFDLAEKHGTAVDFHLDFDLSPEKTNLPAVIEETVRRGYQGRVSLGHMTSLSAMSPDDVQLLARQLKAAGIAVTVLPSTDLFLNGRDHDRLVPRGVAPAHLLASEGVLTSIASNNILNPFTPYGDASLLRMANLYANVAQLSRRGDMQLAFEMISTSAARIMGRDEQPIEIGAPADIILIDCIDREQAIRENARVIFGCKRGRRTFEAPRPSILRA